MVKSNKPKQKAIDMLYKYMSLKFNEPTYGLMSYEAKECALIAVDEILDFLYEKNNGYYYWLEVKKEIEKL